MSDPSPAIITPLSSHNPAASGNVAQAPSPRRVASRVLQALFELTIPITGGAVRISRAGMTILRVAEQAQFLRRSRRRQTTLTSLCLHHKKGASQGRP